ncbi:IS110 family transposase [Clostridium sp. LP20]|uniref:IS110 family transposase n=1 Tax=Clostridium sp. LP20 TaxID=3418665 RepID=UPI003EE7DC67
MVKKVFIGIDIGKERNSVNILNIDGQVLTKKGFEIENDYYGFIKLKEKIDVISNDYEVTYENVIVGFESTGHYWFNLNDYLKDIGIETVMIKTDAVKHRRALEEGQKGKNDTLDARVIASCVRNGNYSYVRDGERELRALQKLARMREGSSVELVAIKNKIHRCIDVCNPVYFKVFGNLNSKTGMALLNLYPSPRDIIDVCYNEVLKRVKDITNKPNLKMIQLYKEECEVCCKYIKEPSYAEKIEMKAYLGRLFIEKQSKDFLDEEIKNIASEVILSYKDFEDIKGIPMIQVISVISEIGDIKNFKNSRTILAYLGLSLRGNSSGKFVGERKINKAGSRIVRKHLFNIVESLIKHNEYFRISYCYYKSYKHQKPKKKEKCKLH